MTAAARALLDTSVVIHPPADLDSYARSSAVSTITLAELAFGLHSADPVRNAAHEARYQLIVQNLAPIPYSASAARLYGALCEAVRQTGRNPRPRRFDLMIASVAADANLPLITRNADDFQGIHPAVRVIAIS